MFVFFLLLNLISPRTWIIPKISHGEVKETQTVKEYTKDTVEYKILQLALDIENLVRSNIDVKYKNVFLSVLPDNKKLHVNVLKRNKNYQIIEDLKKENKIKEDNALLVEIKKLKNSESSILVEENKDREELYAIITEILSIEKANQALVKEVYFQALDNFKFYSLKETSSPSSTADSSFLTYIVSNYLFDDVLKVLKGDIKNKGMLENQGFSFDTTKDLKTNILIPTYACEKDEFNSKAKLKNRSFIIKLCPIKDSIIQMCDLKDDIFKNTAVKNGTIIIINKNTEDADKTLFYSSAINEDIEIMLCKKTPFKILEELSESLLKTPAKKELSKDTKKEEAKPDKEGIKENKAIKPLPEAQNIPAAKEEKK